MMARILVIDDDPLIRRTMQDVLETGGHEVAAAADGEGGLKELEARRFDLVILDILMPDKEGLETLRELRRHNQQTAVLAMTGGAPAREATRADAPMLDYLRMAHALGATRTIRKPFTGWQLLSIVAECLTASDAGT